METIYLKKNYDFQNKIMSVIKHKGENALIAYEGSVKIDEWSDPEYFKSIGYKKTDAKTFDEFYTTQAKKFDEILNP